MFFLYSNFTNNFKFTGYCHQQSQKLLQLLKNGPHGRQLAYSALSTDIFNYKATKFRLETKNQIEVCETFFFKLHMKTKHTFKTYDNKMQLIEDQQQKKNTVI